MTEHSTAILPHRQQLAHSAFVFERAARMRQAIEEYGSLADWNEFAASWNDLVLDAYLVDSGRFRRRRHAVFALDEEGTLRREPHQPHFQSRDYNALYGGIERWFEPMHEAIGASASLHSILRFCAALFAALSPGITRWRVEVHQFRIEARADEPGLPTPEGVHRDGVDYVLVLLVSRQNIASGTTTIHTVDGTLLGSFTLSQPFDAALLDDTRVYHGVTPVEPLDPTLPAHRDVLVVTFRQQPERHPS
jgi:hypothetical protein